MTPKIYIYMSKNKYLAKLKVYIYNFGQIFVFTHFLYSTPNVKKKIFLPTFALQ